MTDLPPPPPPPPPPPTGGGPDAGAALSYGWKKFTENVGPLILIILAPIAVIVVLELIGAFVVRGVVGIVVSYAIALLVAIVGYLGIFNAGLMATRGEHVDFNKAFQTDRWGDWIAFAIVYGLMLAVGFALCLVGALFVVAFWGLAPFYFLDQRKSIGDALSASLEKTRGTPGLPVALGLCGLVAWAGGFACGIGTLVTMPLGVIGGAYLYRRVNNQPVAP